MFSCLQWVIKKERRVEKREEGRDRERIGRGSKGIEGEEREERRKEGEEEEEWKREEEGSQGKEEENCPFALVA